MQQPLGFFHFYPMTWNYLHISPLHLSPPSFLALAYWCTDNYYRYMRFTNIYKSMPLLLWSICSKNILEINLWECTVRSGEYGGYFSKWVALHILLNLYIIKEQNKISPIWTIQHQKYFHFRWSIMQNY